jgi:hypothetical protein
MYGKKTEELRNLATHRIVGDRYQGKSALLGFIMSKYMMRGSTVYDFYSAGDLENLTSLDKTCPFHDKIILVHGPSVKLRCNYETMEISKLDPSKQPPGKLFITCKAFFLSDFERYAALLAFTKKVQLRAQNGWDYVAVLVMREMQEYVNSKIKTNQARTQKEAAEDFIEFHNEAFHSGFSVVLDSQRDVEVAKNLRELNTYTYYKNMGVMDTPDKIKWIMREDGPRVYLGILRTMNKDQFVLVTNRNAVYMGSFQKPPWHIKRGDTLLKQYDITVTDKNDKPIDFLKALEQQAKVEAEIQDPMHSLGGRKSIITPEQDSLILKMVTDGKKTPDIFPILEKDYGYKGSVRTLRERVHDWELKKKKSPEAQPAA